MYSNLSLGRQHQFGAFPNPSCQFRAKIPTFSHAGGSSSDGELPTTRTFKRKSFTGVPDMHFCSSSLQIGHGFSVSTDISCFPQSNVRHNHDGAALWPRFAFLPGLCDYTRPILLRYLSTYRNCLFKFSRNPCLNKKFSFRAKRNIKSVCTELLPFHQVRRN